MEQKQQHRCRRKVSFSDCNNNRIVVIERRNSNVSNAPRRVDPRKLAREEAYQLIRKGYGQLLTRSFEDPADNSQDNINAFVVGIPDIDNGRGLERYVSPQHKDERDLAREDVVEAVLTRQRLMLRRGGDGLSNSERAEKLRSASRRQSRDSKLFARRMGIADELAVRYLNHAQDSLSTNVDLECSNHSLPKERHSFPGATNDLARQPSNRQLEVGIRSMTACMNAKKASRQASVRKLNCSIRSLASSLHSNSSHSHLSCSSVSSSSSTESFSSSIHPSLVLCRNRNRDQALKLPGRGGPPTACECAELIQSALDLVDSAHDKADSDDETSRSPREMAMSA